MMIESLMHLEWEPFILSFKLASITAMILFVVSLPLAWYLATTKSKFKPFLEAVTALPIVLPPSVLGFYILWAFSSNSPIGEFFATHFDISLTFSFVGLVLASCLYSMPFMIQPLQAGFEGLNPHMIESSYIAGKSKLQTLLFVALPNIKPSLLMAFIITFAHTVGEFGVVLMVGGSIPGETKVASVAIYEQVEVMDYTNAHIYSLIMLLISFSVLLVVYIFNHRYKNKLGFR
jgi:molybdate transport system permease protein